MAAAILNCIPILAFLYLFSGVAATQKKRLSANEQRLYERCNENGTVCNGDTEDCVEDGSCVYLVAFWETQEEFHVDYLDLCSHNENNTLDATFFGIGISSYDDDGNPTCDQPLERQNFKFFLFWKERKCFDDGNTKTTDIMKFTIMKSNWTAACETHVKKLFGQNYTMTKDPNDFILRPYLRKYLFYNASQGVWFETQSPYRFADSHIYISKDGIFFISNHTLMDGSIDQPAYFVKEPEEEKSIAIGTHTFDFRFSLIFIALLLSRLNFD